MDRNVRGGVTCLEIRPPELFSALNSQRDKNRLFKFMDELHCFTNFNTKPPSLSMVSNIS